MIIEWEKIEPFFESEDPTVIESCRIIKAGDIIDHNLQHRLLGANHEKPRDLAGLFAKTKGGVGKYKFAYYCPSAYSNPNCQKPLYKNVTKTQFLTFFKALQSRFSYEVDNYEDPSFPQTPEEMEWFCKDCLVAIKEEEKEVNEYFRKNHIDEFILTWLTPLDDWKIPSSYPKMSSSLFADLKAEIHRFSIEYMHHIKNLGYDQYLKTPIWRVISWYVKRLSNFRCRLCASGGKLITHHSNYKRIFHEIFYYQEDLVCLCHDCHEHHHHKKEVRL